MFVVCRIHGNQEVRQPILPPSTDIDQQAEHSTSCANLLKFCQFINIFLTESNTSAIINVTTLVHGLACLIITDNVANH